MKKNARSAFNALKKIGAPVFEGGDWGGEYFIVSGEDNVKEIWADYWQEFGGPGLDDFGVSLKINKILDKNDLFGEWINPGVLGVYDA
tara:strand:+ start:500 stop:763 length:264 start_codon:yes stop_codon:yes gene_type:complete